MLSLQLLNIYNGFIVGILSCRWNAFFTDNQLRKLLRHACKFWFLNVEFGQINN